jgi:hypothetical protein
MHVVEPSQPPRRPSPVPEVDNAAEFVVDAGHSVAAQNWVRALDVPTASARRTQVSPISVINDTNGLFVTEDLLGVVYGVGPTPQESVADYFAALDRRLSLLRRQRAQLHPGLMRELAALERLFPNR